MPPPKRPFTTSSLTSSLKSTLANQPLLNNLTNIDKLSSQASSLAQKTPFFGAINQQFQQHYQQQENQQQHLHNNDAAKNIIKTTQSQANVATVSGNGNLGQLGNSSASKLNNSNLSKEVQQMANSISSGRPSALAGTPSVDMSHLTEEERIMIQSVMAKAEMADMGLPVDTSMPSSTNLPSNTSQALTQQRDLQQKQQQQQQQSQKQLQNNTTILNNQKPSQPENQQNPSQYMPQQNQSIGMLQQPTIKQNYPTDTSSKSLSFPSQQRLNSTNVDVLHTQAPSSQQPTSNVPLNLVQQQGLQQNFNDLAGQQLILAQASLQPLEQQAQQVNQMNSQYNQGSVCDGSGLANQIYDVSQQNYGTSTTNSNVPDDMHQISQQACNSENINELNNTQQMFSSSNLQPQWTVPSSFDQAHLATQHQTQSIISAQIDQNAIIQSDFDQFQTFPGNVNMSNMTALSVGHSIPDNSNYLVATTSNPHQQMLQSDMIQPYQNEVDNFQRAPQFKQQNIIQTINSPMVSSKQRPRINYAAASDMDVEHAFSDQDQQYRQTRRGQKFSKPKNLHQSIDSETRTSRRFKGSATNELEAYDLAQRTTPKSRHKARQLPQPGFSNQSKHASQENSLQSSSEYLYEDFHKSAKKQVKRKVADTAEKQLNRRTNSGIRKSSKSPQYSSVSEDETSSVTDSNEGCPPASTSNQKINKTASIKIQNEERSIENERNEHALKLMSELKLTEQANQVMEQQQLLIKQSQELIKLQQAQLEKQAEAKKGINNYESDKKIENIRADNDKVNKADSKAPLDNKEVAHLSNSENRNSDEESATKIRSTSRHTNDLETQRDKNTKLAQNSCKNTIKDDSDSETCKAAPSLIDVPGRGVDENSRTNRKRQTEKSESVKKRQTPVSADSRSTQTRRRERDLFQSPTDTTDSDVDLISQSSSRFRQHKLTAKSTSAASRIRREPRGLPPSPLPVAAAIQLHQMQQKHNNQTTSSNMNRTIYLRSRSVTSSPNHLLDRYSSGYMTDNQRVRPKSPDTMSEYGGQRRRKRLPDLPTNVLPITPSMVRRMVQNNRSMTANTDRFSNSKTNAMLRPQLATNTVTTYQGYNSDSPSLKYNSDLMKENLNILQMSANKKSSLLDLTYSAKVSSTPQFQSSKIMERQRIDFNPQSSVNLNTNPLQFCDDLLKSSDITDIKETPELDKLISNLDAYYGLEASSTARLSPSHLNSSNLNNSNINFKIGHSSPSPSYKVGLNQTQNSLQTRSYSQKPTYQLTDTYNSTSRHRNDLDSDPYSYNSYSYRSRVPYRPDGLDVRYTDMTRSLPSTSSSSYHRPLSVVYPTRQHTVSYLPPTTEDVYYGSVMKTELNPTQNSRFSCQNNLPIPTHPFQNLPLDVTHNSNSMREPYNEFDNATVTRYCPGTGYLDSVSYGASSDYKSQRKQTIEAYVPSVDQHERRKDSFTPLTKDDIINHGPKFDSIGYRFRTENPNKYVVEPRTPLECLQSRYPNPYKRVLLSKNPKDRIGNGIGVRIIGGQPLPNIYDKVNKCIVTSGAFVTEVFQSSRVYFMDEMHEGDQIIEWNGVNLCNRSDEEVQQILLSQFSDDEVEIIYLNRNKAKDAYKVDIECPTQDEQSYVYGSNDTFDPYYSLHTNFNSDMSKRQPQAVKNLKKRIFK